MKRLLLVGILLARSIAPAQVQTGTITGQVRDKQGKPAAGVRVAAAEITEQPNGGSLVSLDLTDESGMYRLENVPPGQYRIVAGAVAQPTYYPGTEDIANSRIVPVTAASAVEGLDFPLVAPLGVQTSSAAISAGDLLRLFGTRLEIPGQFVMDDGNPLPNVLSAVMVSAASVSNPTATGVGAGVFPNGSFKLGLVAGDYLISVFVRGESHIDDYYVKAMTYGSRDLLNSPLSVAVIVGGGIRITLARGVPVSGRVLTQAGQPANVTVYLVPRLSQRTDLNRRASSHVEGNFVLQGVAPGEYFLAGQSHLDPGQEYFGITVTDRAIEGLNLVLGPGRSLFPAR